MTNNNNVIDTIVLSGGSTSGLLTLGRLYSLVQANKLNFDTVKIFSGTSVGAIICLLLVYGLDPKTIAINLSTSQVFDKLTQINIFDTLRGKGLFSLKPIENEIRKMIETSPYSHVNKMKDLPKRFICPSYNLDAKKLEYFDSNVNLEMDPVVCAIASSAIPFLFEPWIIDNMRFIDGGIVDNFPLVKIVNEGAQNILGIMIVKNQIQQVKNTWSMSDLMNIIFAPCDHNSEQQINFVSNKVNLQLHKLHSTVPFYDVDRSPEQVMLMFVSGFEMFENESCDIL